MDWQLADAKNRFSELVTKALNAGPQCVHRRKDTVMVIAREEYLRLTRQQQSLKQYLLNGRDFAELDLRRDKTAIRDVAL